MLEENYVSFETAKLLKEKGFEGKMHTFYTEEGTEMESSYVVPSNFFPIYRPTLQTAIKWLKTKGLYITTQYFRLDVGSDWATVTVYRMNKYGAEIGFEGYDVEELYDKAINFCCEYLI